MSMLSKDKIKLKVHVKDKFEAIHLAGQLLVDGGHADPKYVEKMIEREQKLSTYMGGGLAVPHGTNDSKHLIHSPGLSIVQLAEGIDFGEGEPAFLVVGIASAGDEHLEILTNVATVCADDASMSRLLQASTAEEIVAIFTEGLDQ